MVIGLIRRELNVYSSLVYHFSQMKTVVIFKCWRYTARFMVHSVVFYKKYIVREGFLL